MNDQPDTRFVGIDYHEGFVQLCVMDASGQRLHERRVANEVAAIVEAAGSGQTVQAALETSTGAADLAEALNELGWSVSLAHPLYVHKLRQSPDKTDLSDAALLADLLRVGYLSRSYKPTAWERELRRLSTVGSFFRLRVSQDLDHASTAGRCSPASTVIFGRPTSHRRACRDCGHWPSPTGPPSPSRAGTCGTSRVPCEEFPRMHRVYDCAGAGGGSR
ncbi:MAG: IS110 family transposase [bacterium]